MFESQHDCRHLSLKFFVINIALTMLFQDTAPFQLEALFLSLDIVRRDSCFERFCLHTMSNDLAPILR
ncbi:MAG: hypothetical protein H0V70_20520 [Ktedonobacteraceae bacterium]|nr:hypothetical protein [Ktedonobacteraceae bacterium]